MDRPSTSRKARGARACRSCVFGARGQRESSTTKAETNKTTDLDRFHAFDELFLHECFDTSVDYGLVQVGLRSKVLRPDS
jgi:hypothetical protein